MTIWPTTTEQMLAICLLRKHPTGQCGHMQCTQKVQDLVRTHALGMHCEGVSPPKATALEVVASGGGPTATAI